MRQSGSASPHGAQTPTVFRAGFTVVELLIASAVLGIILALLGSLLSSNAQLSSRQISAADANRAVELALLRLGEVVAQAHYVYPAGQPLSLNGGATNLTTGRDALALLVPVGANYCRPELPSERYCGFIYSLEPRSAYVPLLGASNDKAGHVLVEWSAQDLAWAPDALPPSMWESASGGVLADSVVAGPGGSSLGAPENLHLSTTQSLFDSDTGFLNAEGTDKTSPLALLSAVEPTLVVRHGKPPKEIGRETYAFSRAIPRGALPVLAGP